MLCYNIVKELRMERFFDKNNKLIDLSKGDILYEHGADDTDALRTDNKNWSAYDSAPLVDAETDTLIWPGENGLIYVIKLNTQYDKEAGTISVSPVEQIMLSPSILATIPLPPFISFSPLSSNAQYVPIMAGVM